MITKFRFIPFIVILLLSACAPQPTSTAVPVIVQPGECVATDLLYQGYQIPTEAGSFCLQTSSGNLVTIQQAQQVSNIRRLLGNPDLQVRFVDYSLMPNSPNMDVYGAFYVDGLARQFIVDADDNRVVEFHGSPTTPSGASLTLDALRAKAEALIISNDPSFATMKTLLTYEEGGKVGNHFFVWKNLNATFTNIIPQVQVGLTEDGQLISYLNTLYLSK